MSGIFEFENQLIVRFPQDVADKLLKHLENEKIRIEGKSEPNW